MVEPIFRTTDPNSGLTADIISRASEEQQARARIMAENMAQTAGAPYGFVGTALDSFVKGRGMARREAQEDQRSQALSKQMLAQDIANQKGGLEVSEEQKRQAGLDAPIEGDPNGKTVRQRLMESKLGAAEAETKSEQSNADYADKLNQARLQATQQGTATLSKQLELFTQQLKDAQKESAIKDLGMAAAGINASPTMTPQEKLKRQEALQSDFQAHHPDLDPHYAAGAMEMAKRTMDLQLAQTRNAQDVFDAGSPAYQQIVAPAVNDTTKKLAALDKIDSIINEFNNNVVAKSGTNGYAINSPISSQLMKQFADTVDNFDPAHPSAVGTAAMSQGGLDLRSAAQKMQDLRAGLMKETQNTWQSAKKMFPPNLAARGEVGGIDKRFEDKNTPGNPASGKRGIGQTNQTAQQKRSIFNNGPIQPGTAVAQPGAAQPQGPFGAPAPMQPGQQMGPPQQQPIPNNLPPGFGAPPPNWQGEP